MARHKENLIDSKAKYTEYIAYFVIYNISSKNLIMPPRRFDHVARSSVPIAVATLLSGLYRDALQAKPRNFKTPRRDERNQAVRIRFANGENTIDLAKAFGISRKRVYQIIHGQRK